ncbi:MAG: Nif3-like dinuclear metal center hexameric protein [Phycisphaerales bacterium]|nr:Nif3-like dinuclear metal center hexameric protein [Phycisphaerales bacterium]
MILRDLLQILDDMAPTRYAEAWDNVGLLAGDPDQQINRAMLAIDYTREVAAEAQREECDFIIAYHPPIFSPVKRMLSGDVLYDAIRGGVAIYSPHTALDVAPGGTNDLLADILGLTDRQPLRFIEPKAREHKFTTFVPEEAVERVAEALYAAGAGGIGRYTRCSFRTPGTGTFMGDQTTNPTIGKPGVYEETPEIKLEMLCPIDRVPDVLAALRKAHPYEEPAFDLVHLAAPVEKLGQGRIGNLPATPLPTLLMRIKHELQLPHLLVAGQSDQTINRAAVLAGSGREHLKDAIAQGAQLYLTGEIPHHDALAAAKAGVTVVATLHSNSERASLKRLRDRLAESTRAVPFLISNVDRDPFQIL